MPTYYRVLDKDILGRQDNMFSCFLYSPGKGWQPDESNLLMDRIIGYDEDGIGQSDMMMRIEEIPEEEAMEIIASLAG